MRTQVAHGDIHAMQLLPLRALPAGQLKQISGSLSKQVAQDVLQGTHKPDLNDLPRAQVWQSFFAGPLHLPQLASQALQALLVLFR